MSDSVSIEFVRQVVLQLLAGEWVDTNDVCSALDLDFKTCMHTVNVCICPLLIIYLLLYPRSWKLLILLNFV